MSVPPGDAPCQRPPPPPPPLCGTHGRAGQGWDIAPVFSVHGCGTGAPPPPPPPRSGGGHRLRLLTPQFARGRGGLP